MLVEFPITLELVSITSSPAYVQKQGTTQLVLHSAVVLPVCLIYQAVWFELTSSLLGDIYLAANCILPQK